MKIRFRALFVLFVLTLCFLIVYPHSSEIRGFVENNREVIQGLSNYGVLISLLFVVVVALAVTAGCPRLILSSLGGFVFGFWEGLFLSQLGTIVGLYFLFRFVRWGGGGGREIQAGHSMEAGNWDFMKSCGIAAVIIARQMPLPTFVVTSSLALTKVRDRDFIIGTMIGILPQGVPATLVGSGVRLQSAHGMAVTISIALACLAAVWALTRWYLRYTRNLVK